MLSHVFKPMPRITSSARGCCYELVLKWLEKGSFDSFHLASQTISGQPSHAGYHSVCINLQWEAENVSGAGSISSLPKQIIHKFRTGRKQLICLQQLSSAHMIASFPRGRLTCRVVKLMAQRSSDPLSLVRSRTGMVSRNSSNFHFQRSIPLRNQALTQAPASAATCTVRWEIYNHLDHQRSGVS